MTRSVVALALGPATFEHRRPSAHPHHASRPSTRSERSEAAVAQPPSSHPSDIDRSLATMTMDRIKLALDVGRTGVWCFDPATGTFTGDTGVALLWGRPRDAPLNAAEFRAGLHQDDATRVETELRQAASDTSPERFLIEFRIMASPGEERWITLEGRKFSPHGAQGGIELLGIGLRHHGPEGAGRACAPPDARGDASVEEPAGHHPGDGAADREGQSDGRRVRARGFRRG